MIIDSRPKANRPMHNTVGPKDEAPGVDRTNPRLVLAKLQLIYWTMSRILHLFCRFILCRTLGNIEVMTKAEFISPCSIALYGHGLGRRPHDAVTTFTLGMS